jgi:hypothetical protein
MTALAALLLAADLTGMWAGQVPGRNGPVDIAFKIEQTGTRLSGKLYGDTKSSPIVAGTVAGDLVTFVVSTVEQAGNQFHETRIRYTGRLVEGGELEIIRERESAKDAASGAAVAPRALDKAPFRIRWVQ